MAISTWTLRDNNVKEVMNFTIEQIMKLNIEQLKNYDGELRGIVLRVKVSTNQSAYSLQIKDTSNNTLYKLMFSNKEDCEHLLTSSGFINLKFKIGWIKPDKNMALDKRLIDFNLFNKLIEIYNMLVSKHSSPTIINDEECLNKLCPVHTNIQTEDGFFLEVKHGCVVGIYTPWGYHDVFLGKTSDGVLNNILLELSCDPLCGTFDKSEILYEVGKFNGYKFPSVGLLDGYECLSEKEVRIAWYIMTKKYLNSKEDKQDVIIID